MSELKNNLEEVWNQEYRDFMLSFYPESSPLVSTWEIYRMAKIKSQKGIESVRTQLLAQCKISRELLVEKEQLEQELQKTEAQLCGCRDGVASLKKEIDDKIDSYLELKNELQKTREQLKSANIVIHHVVYNTNDSQGLAYEYLEANLLLK